MTNANKSDLKQRTIELHGTKNIISRLIEVKRKIIEQKGINRYIAQSVESLCGTESLPLPINAYPLNTIDGMESIREDLEEVVDDKLSSSLSEFTDRLLRLVEDIDVVHADAVNFNDCSNKVKARVANLDKALVTTSDGVLKLLASEDITSFLDGLKQEFHIVKEAIVKIVNALTRKEELTLPIIKDSFTALDRLARCYQDTDKAKVSLNKLVFGYESFVNTSLTIISDSYSLFKSLDIISLPKHIQEPKALEYVIMNIAFLVDGLNDLKNAVEMTEESFIEEINKPLGIQ